MKRIIKLGMLSLLVSNVRATMMPDKEKANYGLARVNKELGLARKQVRPARKEKYASRQQRKLVLSWIEFEGILCRDDLATFEKVAWKSVGMTKDEMLRKACIYGAPKIAFILIKEEANVNYIDEIGNIPLHWAVSMKEVKVAKLLIREGANVNQKNCLGWTPLYYVLETGDVSLAKLFIEVGANIDSKDKNNRNVLEVGIWNNNLKSSLSGDNERRLEVMNYIKSVVKKKNRLL